MSVTDLLAHLGQTGELLACVLSLLQGLLWQNKQTLFWEGGPAPNIRVINVIDVVVREVFIS